jgi:hypothetical protein
MFAALYLCAVILFYRGLAPLRQFASLLGELTPIRKAPAVRAEVVEE